MKVSQQEVNSQKESPNDKMLKNGHMQYHKKSMTKQCKIRTRN